MKHLRISHVYGLLQPPQRRTYDYIKKYSLENGKFPTFRDISYNTGVVLSAAKYQIDKLVRLGLIEYEIVGSKKIYRLAGLYISTRIDATELIEVDEVFLKRVAANRRGPLPGFKNKTVNIGG